MPKKSEPYYVYMLRCVGGSLYTGVTNNVQKRFIAHQRGKGAKYTRAYPPIAVVYVEECKGRGGAQQREAEIKKLSHTEKSRLAKLEK